MQYAERHPLLGLYWRIGWCLVVIGGFWAAIGYVSGKLAAPRPAGASLAPWQLAWWEQFGWGNGLFLLLLGAVILLYRVVIKRRILFGDRIRKEY